MDDYQKLEEHYRRNPQAETPAPGKTTNDERVKHEVAKKNASK